MTMPSTFELAEDTILSPISGAGGILVNLNRGVYALNPRAKDVLDRALSLTSSNASSSRQTSVHRFQAERLFWRQLHRAGLLRSNSSFKKFFYRALARAISYTISFAFRPSLQRKLGLFPAINLIYWSNRLLGFGRMTRVVQEVQLLDISATDSHAASIDNDLQEAVARCWLRITCKEVALVAYLQARQRHQSPQLVVGLGEYPVNLHTWVEVDGQVITDFTDRCEQMHRIHTVTN